MGRGIARNLDAGGCLVAAMDRNADAFSDTGFSGRVQNLAADELIDLADIVFFAVPTVDEISDILGAHAPGAGQLIVDLTTSAPEASRGLASRIAGQGASYLDAAMTGGAAGADAGTLTLMVGGDAGDVARAAPVFDVIARKVFHLGPVGAGHAMKLVHNMILHSSFLATCEGLRLAERAGIDPKDAVEVLNAGNARSFVTEVRFPRDILSGTMAARSRTANLEKDLGLAVRLARDEQAAMPFGSLAHALLTVALASGQGDRDFSWLFPMYDELAEGME